MKAPSGIAPSGGTNLDYARSFNRNVMIEAVRLKGPVSRAELTRMTHLSAQTVSNIVAELLNAGLLLEEGRRQAKRGQPAIDLVLNPDGAATIGLTIEQSQLTAILVNLVGETRARRTLRLDRATPAEVLPKAAALVADLTAITGSTPLWGVGIAMPGPFAVDGADFSSPMTLPDWGGVDIIGAFTQLLDLPVELERDAAAAARAEYLYGAARQMQQFFYLHFGVGLGGAYARSGHPLRGMRGNAGEIGLIPARDGRPLEDHVSRLALERAVAAAGADPASLTDPSAPATAAWIARAAPELRRAICILENLFDPQSIVLGGNLPPPVLSALIAALHPLDPSIADTHDRRFPRVTAAALGPDGQAQGAAALPVFETLSPQPASLRKSGSDDPGLPLSDR
jgi:predicted NBD/HSP70 family sugar kinase